MDIQITGLHWLHFNALARYIELKRWLDESRFRRYRWQWQEWGRAGDGAQEDYGHLNTYSATALCMVRATPH
jgi:hypothetical protein